MGNGADEGNLDMKGRRFMKKYLLYFLLIYFFVAGAYLIIRSGFETVADITTSLKQLCKDMSSNEKKRHSKTEWRLILTVPGKVPLKRSGAREWKASFRNG